MSEQPEALRLARALIERHGVESFEGNAAAELRRLHQFAEAQIGRATAAEAALQMTKATHALKIAALERQRDALLEELISFTKSAYIRQQHPKRFAAAVAAIKAVEEEA